MRKLLYIIGFIFCAGGLNAQLDFGFMGKKNSVQLNTYSALNLLHIAENAFSTPDLLIGFRCFLESGFAIPLNQNFFFNIKYRVGLNIVLSNPEELSDPNNQILVDRNDFKKSLRSKVIGNIMDFNLGIAYQF